MSNDLFETIMQDNYLNFLSCNITFINTKGIIDENKNEEAKI